MGDINSILQAYALQEADKQRIAQSSPYLGAQSAATGINDFILKSSANPEYSTSEKIIAGLLGGLVSGGIESYNDDWQSRAEKEFISASQGGRQSVFDTLAGKPATPVKRDLLPRSVFDTAEQRGQESGLRSVFDTINDQREFEREIEALERRGEIDTAGKLKLLYAEKPWLEPNEPMVSDSAKAGVSGEASLATPAQNSIDQQAMELARSGAFSSPAEARRELIRQQERKEDLQREDKRRVFTDEDSYRKEIKALPSVTQFLAMQRSLPLVESFKDQDTRSSDVGFVYNFVKSLDEGAVRGEEINLANSANPIIQQYAERLQGAFTGESQLTPRLKNQMYGELVGAQSNVFSQAKKDAEVVAGIAQRRGVNSENLYPFDTALNFDGTPTQSTQAVQAISQVPLDILMQRAQGGSIR